jgi:hypothetical protein
LSQLSFSTSGRPRFISCPEPPFLFRFSFFRQILPVQKLSRLFLPRSHKHICRSPQSSSPFPPLLHDKYTFLYRVQFQIGIFPLSFHKLYLAATLPTSSSPSISTYSPQHFLLLSSSPRYIQILIPGSVSTWNLSSFLPQTISCGNLAYKFFTQHLHSPQFFLFSYKYFLAAVYLAYKLSPEHLCSPQTKQGKYLLHPISSNPSSILLLHHSFSLHTDEGNFVRDLLLIRTIQPHGR